MIARDSFARYLAEVAIEIRQHSQTVEFPEADLRAQLRRLAPYGLGNFRTPIEHGGVGADLVTAGLLHETAAQIVPELSGPALINDGVGLLLTKIGSAALRERYQQPLVRGELIAASANSEPGAGSDVGNIATTARRRSDRYVLRGHKTWITNGHIADFVIVLARTEDNGKLDLFLVDGREHGFESRDVTLAGRTTAAELIFDDTEVPLENRLTAGTGLRAMLAAFQVTRGLVALSATGMARKALDLAIDHARFRKTFGMPIAASPLIQAKLADCLTRLEAARLLAYDALATAAANEEPGVKFSLAKLFATEAAQDIVACAAQLHGASGLADGMAIERLAQAVRIFTVVEGTSDIQRLIIGRAMTGFDAFAREM